MSSRIPTLAMTARSLADHLGGFVAAEGTFSVHPDRPRADRTHRSGFRFAVALGARDTPSVELLQDFLGVGRVRQYPRRKEHYDDEVVFAVRALDELTGVVVPFLDEHLPPSHKREQYLAWRQQLLAYDAERPARAGWSRRRPEP